MTDEIQTPSEIETLKARATQLKIEVDGRWGVEKLREVVNAALASEGPAVAEPVTATAVEGDGEIQSPVAVTQMPSLADALAAERAERLKPVENETEGARKNRLRREATALVRVNVSCMDPMKKNLKGELLCISNRNIGTIQRFIPFNRDWHIEKCLYDELLSKEFMVFEREKTGRAGIEVATPRNVPAFNIRVLPPLTKGELKDLAQRQAMANGTGE